MTKEMIKKLSRILPDKTFVKVQYKYFTGKSLDLNKPEGFNEKLQWLKIHDRKSIYTTIVDKYSVREYVKKRIGQEYLVPLFGKYENAEQINWQALPNSFVLKCTHGSGTNILCPNKVNLDYDKSNSQLNKWLNTNFFYKAREWPYKNVKPQIICEKYLEDDIYDYKFYCFNGQPKFLNVSQGDKKDKRMNFYDLNWNKCEFYREDHKKLNNDHMKPDNFEEMKELAHKLSQDFPFVRVDLFNVAGKLYFGELTLTPGAGVSPFYPSKWETIIGDWLDISFLNK